VEQNAGYGANLSFSIKVGDYEEHFSDSGSTPWRQEFSLTVPIPQGETKGKFSIMVTGSYNAGDRTLFVGADFAPENVVPVTVSGQVYTPLQRVDSDRGFPAAVRSSWRAPLAGVAVDLVRVGPGAPGNQPFEKLASTTANDAGQYTFANVPVTTSLAISVGLQSVGLAVWDASAAPANYGEHNPLPTPATPVFAISQPFAVTGAADLTADLAFARDGSFTYPAAGSPLLARLDSFGLVYYHTWQALQLAAQLGVNLDAKPLPVYGFLDNAKGAYWRGPNSAGDRAGVPPHIVIGGATPNGGVAYSHVNDGSRADNREWHEFGHHFLADASANLLPIDGALPRDNHAGYMNASTGDSWIEGFAEFFSLVVNREIAEDGTPPQLYSWGGNTSNLEANWKSWDFRGAQSLEEFAVASLLWDLLDPADAKDKTVLTQLGAGGVKTASYADWVEIPLPTLWSHLAHDRGGVYGYNLHIQHLYEVLKANGVGAAVASADNPEFAGAGLTALDELFVAHGFFADTGPHLDYFDVGETVGTTGYLSYTVTYSPTLAVTIPERLQRPSPPPVPDAYVKVAVVDEAGKPVNVTQFDVTVRFDAPFDVYNFSYEATATDGRLFFLPAPPDYPGTISVTPHGQRVAAPLELTNEFVWTAPADGAGVIASHTFVVDKSSSLYLPLVMKVMGQTPTATDNFCDHASGWPDNDANGYSLHYLAGPPCQYQIRIDVDEHFAGATPGWSASNYKVEGLVRLDSTHAGGAGLLFGLNNDWSRFYTFGIGTNQKYWLSRYEGGAWTNLIAPTKSTLFSLTAENTLRVDSQGTRFTIYVNGTRLDTIDDGAAHAGRVGLFAEGLAGFDARFRGFSLWDQAAASASAPAGEMWPSYGGQSSGFFLGE
jgi:hypothetical protein